MNFRITKAELRALLAFASTDITRPHMTGVHFDAINSAVVATDGHRLALLKREGVGTFTVSKDDLARALKACPNKSELQFAPGQDSSGRFIAVETVDAAGNASPLFPAKEVTSGRFPPYQQVIPERPTAPGAVCICIDGAYLADLGLVAKTVSGRDIVCFAPTGTESPVRFEASGWTLVLMPRRHVDVELLNDQQPRRLKKAG